MSILSRILLGIAVVIGTVLTMAVPSAASFENPDLARMVFWHLPCALATPAFAIFGSYYSVQYLRGKGPKFDVLAAAANEMALLLGVLTLVTGMVFADVQWGTFWNWDPRQTSFLLAFLILCAYFALRAAFDDADRRAANSAAYSAAALLPILFLVFVFPKLKSVTSLHPNVIRDGGFDPTYRGVFLVMLVLIGTVATIFFRLRVRTELLSQQIDHDNAELAARRHSAHHRLVRTSDAPSQDGGPTETA